MKFLLLHKIGFLRDGCSGQETEYRFDPESPIDAAVVFFCRNIASGLQGTQSRWTGYDVDNLIEAIQASAPAGQALDINWRT